MAVFKKNDTEPNENVNLPEDDAAKKEKKEKAPKEKKKKNIPVRIAVLLLILALIGATIQTVLNMRILDGTNEEIPADFTTPDYLKDKTMNILICGIDTDDTLEGEDARNVNMTDVIMVLNLDREANKATILQIPRDTYVGQDLVPYGKINGLYQWGFTNELPEDETKVAGVNPLVETIYKQFGLPIDGYVLITMEGFRNAVDLLGGVEVVLPDDMEPIDIEGFGVFQPGVNSLNGAAAEVFVRNRDYEGADIDRLHMQTYFMEGLMKKLMETSNSELMRLATNIFNELQSDMSVSELLALVNEAKKLDTEGISVIQVPGEPVAGPYGLYNQTVHVYSVHKKELADLLNEYMRPHQEAVHESELEAIEIQNTTNSSYGATVLGEGGNATGENGENPEG